MKLKSYIVFFTLFVGCIHYGFIPPKSSDSFAAPFIQDDDVISQVRKEYIFYCSKGEKQYNKKIRCQDIKKFLQKWN